MLRTASDDTSSGPASWFRLSPWASRASNEFRQIISHNPEDRPAIPNDVKKYNTKAAGRPKLRINTTDIARSCRQPIKERDPQLPEGEHNIAARARARNNIQRKKSARRLAKEEAHRLIVGSQVTTEQRVCRYLRQAQPQVPSIRIYADDFCYNARRNSFLQAKCGRGRSSSSNISRQNQYGHTTEQSSQVEASTSLPRAPAVSRPATPPYQFQHKTAPTRRPLKPIFSTPANLVLNTIPAARHEHDIARDKRPASMVLQFQHNLIIETPELKKRRYGRPVHAAVSPRPCSRADSNITTGVWSEDLSTPKLPLLGEHYMAAKQDVLRVRVKTEKEWDNRQYGRLKFRAGIWTLASD